jgi:hypothetical protein
MTADWPDDNPSPHRALAIYSQTVPLGVKSQKVGNATIAVPAGTISAPVVGSVSQIGWELAVSFNATSSNGNPVRIVLTWTDSITGITTDIDSVYVFPGTVAAPHVFRYSGRTKGDTVSIVFDNTAPAVTANITWTLLQNSRVYTREEGKTLSWVAPTGISNPSFDVTADIVLQSTPTVAGGGNVQRFIPLYIGDVWLHADTQSLTTDMQIFVSDASPNGLPILQDVSNAKGVVETFLTLPRSQCSLTMINNNVAAQIIHVEIVASKRP